MEWLNTALSVAGGGIFGLIGAGVNKFFDYKKQAQANKQELAMADKMSAQMDKEMELAQIKGSIDLELTETDNDAKGLMAAINAEQSIGEVHKWVNDVRGMTRPVITAVLVVFAFLGKPDETIDWMASTAVTFWFGDRPRKK